MPISKSDNAIMAKVHALYGQRLNAEDYGKLLQKRTIPEIAGFLKDETYYSETLSEVKGELVHREQLELMIGRRELDIYVKLRKYSYNEDIFFKMYKMKNEIRQLLSAMRLLNANAMNKFIVSLPGYLAKHLSFDLFGIAKAKNYDDLLSALKNTDYYGVMGRFRPVTNDKPVNIPACENALLTYYYSKLLKIINGEYSKTAQEYLKRLIYYQIDFHNVSMIFRMKRYYKASQKVIASYLIPIRAKVSEAAYKELIEAPDVREMGEALKRYRISDIYPADMSLSSDYVIFNAQKSKMRITQRIFRFSGMPVVAVMCYMMMLEIEVNNIINIIEGMRYQLPPEEIKAMLVI